MTDWVKYSLLQNGIMKEPVWLQVAQVSKTTTEIYNGVYICTPLMTFLNMYQSFAFLYMQFMKPQDTFRLLMT